MDNTLKNIMELKLVERRIIDCGEDWIQLDTGLKIYLSAEEVQSIVG